MEQIGAVTAAYDKAALEERFITPFVLSYCNDSKDERHCPELNN